MDVASTSEHKKKHKKHKKLKKSDKKRKRKRSHSSSSDSSSSDDGKRSKKHHNKKKKSKKSHKEEKLKKKVPDNKLNERKSDSDQDYGIPLDLMNTKAKAPESKEEYEKRQSQIRKVYDEETGRHRLIKGDGEEIVSKKAHDMINKSATRADGSTFQNRLGLKD
uniref:ADP-ribosylation factor-like protein 6-interacting protein 4 n=1 Tax=Culicoides sonorensis TaxID=179676 RepID=A0A336MVM9_CULSO